MSEEQNDSPAFRLRPRRAEPKSYYTVRLEYSANPAAFTREKPRSNTKRKALSQKTSASYSKTKSGKIAHYDYAGGGQLAATTMTLATPPKPIVISKEELEQEERRKRLQREIAESITTDVMISPFIQRLELDELKADSVYDQNYITLKIKNVERYKQSNERHLVCKCCGTHDSMTKLYLNVHLFDEYASDSLVKAEKMINVAKFRTSGPTLVSDNNNDGGDRGGGDPGINWIGFDVIVKYDGKEPKAGHRPLIPFVSITDMIEKPTEPFVEMSPPSPIVEITPSGNNNINRYHHHQNDDDENHESKKVKFTANTSPTV